MIRTATVLQIFAALMLCSLATLAQTDRSSAMQRLPGNATFVVRGSTNALDVAAPPAGSRIFLNPVKYPTGGYDPYSVAIADVNGDGHLDLVVANQEQFGTESSVGVLLGNGDGTFQKAVTYDAGGISAYSIAVADVNADGHPDLLVADGCSSAGYCSPAGVLAVLLGNGDGTFQSAKTYDTGGSDIYHSNVVVADLNGDHKLDVAISHGCGGTTCSTGSVSVLLGDGTGSFGAATTYASGGNGASWVAIADMNGDHKPDLVAVNWCSALCGTSTPIEGSVGVLLGNGNGTFQSAVSYPSGGNGSRSVSLADVNGDGKMDVLTASCGPEACAPGFPGGTAAVLLGNGNGTLQTAVAYTAGNAPDAILATDLNGDGKLDLVVGNWGTTSGANNHGTISILAGTGTGTFQAARTLSPGGNEVPSVASADLNGDGKPDVVTVNIAGSFEYNTPGSVSVLLNNH